MKTRMTSAIALMAWCGCTFAGIGFDPPVQAAGGPEILAVSTGDLNGDGREDVVVLRPESPTSIYFVLQFHLQGADGVFSAGRIHTLDWSLTPESARPYLVAADLDQDGDPDFVAKVGSDFSIARNDRASLEIDNFNLQEDYTDLHVIDANRDGDPDIIGKIPDDWYARVIYVDDSAGFERGVYLQLADNVDRLEFGDVDGDGWPDMLHALQDGVYMNHQGISFFSSLPEQILDVTSAAVMPVMAAGDFNGDGRVDLALDGRVEDGSPLQLYFQDADGTYPTGDPADVSIARGDLRAMDFDGDGHLDLITMRPQDDSISIVRGRGDGTFEAEQQFGIAMEAPELVDMNGDGVVDLVDTAPGGKIVIHRGRRDGGDDLAVRLGLGAGAAKVRIDNLGDAMSPMFSLVLEVQLEDGTVEASGALAAGCVETGTGDSLQVECNLPGLAPGDADAFEIPLVLSSGGLLSAEALVAPSPTDLQPANNHVHSQVFVRAGTAAMPMVPAKAKPPAPAMHSSRRDARPVR